MNVQEWLEEVKKLDELINAKLAERQRLIEIATDISPKAPNGMPFNNTGTVSQKMQDAVVNLIDLEKQLDKLIDKYVDYKQNVIKVLEQLPDKEYGVLHRYYIRGMTWEKVAEDMDIAVMSVYRHRKKAFVLLNVMLNCDKM